MKLLKKTAICLRIRLACSNIFSRCLNLNSLSPKMSNILEIDGSVLEGGGQILRISISLSAIMGIPVRVTNIRARRSKPGLAAQHLKGIQLVAAMCQAKVKGDSIGSTEIEFSPGKIRGGHYVADTQTAGSVALLLQVALPCALFADAPVTLDLKGGTNADMAPQIDYMTEVFRPMLRKFDADFGLTINRRGYFPKGGGHVTVEVSPLRKLKSINLKDRGAIKRMYGWSFVAGTLPIKVAYQMSDGAREQLGQELGRISIDCYKEERQRAPDNCSGVILCCELTSGCILGGDALGRRGVDSASVGRKAGEELLRALRSGACVDCHAQDQLILYMALADGKSAVRAGEITLHTTTAIHIAELIAKTKFTISEEGDQNIIECNGLGFINQNIPT